MTSRILVPFERAVLRDGSVIHVRQVAPGDGPLLEQGFAELSDESRYRRFLHPVKRLTEAEIEYFTHVDHENHEALIAVGPDGAEPVGIARYVRIAASATAEVAIAVVDRWQGRGVGTVLLHELVERARRAGIARFTALCLADNAGVIDLLSRLGSTRIDHPEPGLAELSIELPEHGSSDGELYATLRHFAAGRIEAA